MITKSRKKRHIEGALPWLIPVAIIIIWEVIVDAGMIDTTYVPSPSAVGSQAITLWQEGTLQQNIGISLYRATIGLLIGGTIGFTLGVANGLSRISNLLFNSTVQIVRNIPHLALIPLIII